MKYVTEDEWFGFLYIAHPTNRQLKLTSHRYKLVPDHLADRMAKAVEALRKIQKEIERYQDL